MYVDNGGPGPESRNWKSMLWDCEKMKMLGIGSLRLEIWGESDIAIVYLMGMVRERVKKSQKNENE